MNTLKIQDEIQRRNIHYLVHFTDVSNLPSIMENGLLSISKMNESHLGYINNDQFRLDNQPNGISLSVEFPNYKMLYYYQNQGDRDFVILLLNPLSVLQKKCAYFYTNAANRCFQDKDVRVLNTDIDWNLMFSEDGRDRYNPQSYTTDPQAEILCFEDIPPTDILKVVYPSKDVYEKYPNNMINTLIDNQRYYFKYRRDYKIW